MYDFGPKDPFDPNPCWAGPDSQKPLGAVGAQNNPLEQDSPLYLKPKDELEPITNSKKYIWDANKLSFD